MSASALFTKRLLELGEEGVMLSLDQLGEIGEFAVFPGASPLCFCSQATALGAAVIPVED